MSVIDLDLETVIEIVRAMEPTQYDKRHKTTEGNGTPSNGTFCQTQHASRINAQSQNIGLFDLIRRSTMTTKHPVRSSANRRASRRILDESKMAASGYDSGVSTLSRDMTSPASTGELHGKSDTASDISTSAGSAIGNSRSQRRLSSDTRDSDLASFDVECKLLPVQPTGTDNESLQSEASRDNIGVQRLSGHSQPITQCHAMTSHIVTSSLDSTVRLWPRDVSHNAALESAATLDCKSPVNCFRLLCRQKRSSSKTVVVVLAATEAGTLDVWNVRIRPSRSEDHVASKSAFVVKSRHVDCLPIYKPNPLTSLTVSDDWRHLATGSCFRTFVVNSAAASAAASKPSVAVDTTSTTEKRLVASERGTLKTWDTRELIDAALTKRCKRCRTQQQSSVVDAGSCKIFDVQRDMLTLLREKTASRIVSTAADDVDFTVVSCGITALSYNSDGSLLAVGLGGQLQQRTSFSSKSHGMLVVCDAESLDILFVADRLDCTTVSHVVCRAAAGLDGGQFGWQLLAVVDGKLHMFCVPPRSTGSDVINIRSSKDTEERTTAVEKLHSIQQYTVGRQPIASLCLSPDGSIVALGASRTCDVLAIDTWSAVYSGAALTSRSSNRRQSAGARSTPSTSGSAGSSSWSKSVKPRIAGVAFSTDSSDLVIVSTDGIFRQYVV